MATHFQPIANENRRQKKAENTAKELNTRSDELSVTFHPGALKQNNTQKIA